MNLHKTELMWFGSRTNLQILSAIPGTSSLTITSDVVQRVNAVRDLGRMLTSSSQLNERHHLLDRVSANNKNLIAGFIHGLANVARWCNDYGV